MDLLYPENRHGIPIILHEPKRLNGFWCNEKLLGSILSRVGEDLFAFLNYEMLEVRSISIGNDKR